MWQQKKSWEEFSASLIDCQFRHYFRMPWECFDLLCMRIQDNVGEGTFKSEAYLREKWDDTTLAPPDSVSMCWLRRLAKAHFVQYGGFISGEVKLAITLCMLAGGSYLDLGLIFGTGTSYPYEIFCKVICHWICQDKLVTINGIEYCNDEQRMEEVGRDFGNFLNHLFGGCIGAIDGWIVKIKQPSKKDNVSNPKSFYSWKGFHGVSVQAIVDRKKRILFRSIELRGAEHDSTAFKRTGLYQWLLDNWWRLKRNGY